MFSIRVFKPKQPHKVGDMVWFLWDAGRNAEKRTILHVLDGGKAYIIDDVVSQSGQPSQPVYRVVVHDRLVKVAGDV